MIITYEKIKNKQNKNREKNYLVSSNSLISLGINNYNTRLVKEKILLGVNP